MSTRFDLVVKNARIVAPLGVIKGGVGVHAGKISEVFGTSKSPAGDRVIEAEGRFLLPGLIDAHVHFRDPGTPHREDFESGTRAAAAGGVTTVLEMPISTPSVHNGEILRRRIGAVKGKAVVDFAFYGAAGADNVEEIASLAEAGAIAFKTFMTSPPPGREREYEGLCAPDRDSLLRVIKAVRETGLRLSVHAEDSGAVNTLIEKLKREGRKDPMAHVESRPSHVEEEAIARLISLARDVGTPIHIAHMSTMGGVQLVRDAKASGQNLTAETCPHYLLLTSEAMEEYGPYAKINPPLRGAEDVDALWRAVNDGTIDIIASDHAPYTREEKDVGWKDIWRALSGTPQIELMLPLLLTEVRRGRISLERLVEVTSEAVARTFGIFPMKGAIQVGSDADLVIADLEAEGEIDAERLYTKARDITIYHGWGVQGMPTTTIVRGEVVMEGGDVVGEPGHGRFISPIETPRR